MKPPKRKRPTRANETAGPALVTPPAPSAPETAEPAIGLIDPDVEDLEQTEEQTPDEPRPLADLPAKCKKVSSGEFFATLKRIPAREWARLIVYIWRQWPVIDRKLVDPSAFDYIEKVGQPFDERYIERAHGSGHYFLILNDADRPKQNREVLKTVVKINNPEFPAVFDVNELVLGHKENASVEARLKAEGRHPQQSKKSGGGGGANVNDTVINRLLDAALNKKDDNSGAAAAMSLMTATYSGLIQQAIGQQDPTKVVELLARLKTAVGGAQEGGNAYQILLPLIIQMMQESQKQSNQLVLALLNRAPEPPAPVESKTAIEQLQEFQQFGEILGSISAGKNPAAAAAEVNPWQLALSTLAPVLAQLVQLGTAYIASRVTAGPAATAGNPNVPPPPGSVVQQPAIGYRPPVAAPAPPTPGAAAPPPGQAPPAAAGGTTQLPPHEHAMALELGGRLIDAIRKEQHGADFAEALIGFYDRLTYDRVASLGVQGIVERIRTIPEIWQVLSQSEPSLVQFLTEFVDYGKQPAEDAGAAELLPPGA